MLNGDRSDVYTHPVFHSSLGRAESARREQIQRRWKSQSAISVRCHGVLESRPKDLVLRGPGFPWHSRGSNED